VKRLFDFAIFGVSVTIRVGDGHCITVPVPVRVGDADTVGVIVAVAVRVGVSLKGSASPVGESNTPSVESAVWELPSIPELSAVGAISAGKVIVLPNGSTSVGER